MQGKELQGRLMSAFWQIISRAVCAASFGIILITSTTTSAAIPVGLAEDAGAGWEITAERWQRFLTASRSRYQALAEKAGALHGFNLEDCVAPPLSLAERRECLRGDVFARSAMEHEGMVLDEYATVLHLTVAALPQSPISAQQRGQFQRLRAEWWPAWRTASQ